MRISDVAKLTGLDVKTIRYYESIGLVDAPPRSGNGYRDYSDQGVKQLTFLRHARQFGFSIKECRDLLALWANPECSGAEVYNLVAEKVSDIDEHISDLKSMKKVLSELLAQCPDKDDPAYTMIDRLAAELE